MRLSDVLSKPPSKQFLQVDGFLQDKKGFTGQKVDISVGKVALNFFCKNCDDLRTFYSTEKLTCIFVNQTMISVDCVLICGCNNMIPIWFLIESQNKINELNPKVRILKRNEKFSDSVQVNNSRYGNFSTLLDKAERAYNEGLGAGSIVYLRKILELIFFKIAAEYNIEIYKKNGKTKQFNWNSREHEK